ncbi:hypothetical protein [Nocardioides lijunqiniae]|uniref:hypothetical protein n=1 Tax=Nocardioides lijunqiniae TaxID=2760832 RepID=UPI001878AE91|nr:hypothetical protein [Nocardioides lijunqiniae]
MRRRWLLVLPVALVLALLATASRLQVFWWPEQQHDVTTGRQGEPVEVSDRWEDADGDERRRELSVTLLEVVSATQVEGFSGPETLEPVAGSAVWEVRLRLDADPDVPLSGCRLSIVDTDDREATAMSAQLGETLLPGPACEPEDRAGPRYDGTPVEGALPRPPSYDVSVLVVTDDEAVPDRVRLWWEAPDVTEIRLAGR